MRESRRYVSVRRVSRRVSASNSLSTKDLKFWLKVPVISTALWKSLWKPPISFCRRNSLSGSRSERDAHGERLSDTLRSAAILTQLLTAPEQSPWPEILSGLERRLNKETFETWLRPLRLAEVDSSRRLVRLLAPNGIVRDWVASNYSSALRETLDELHLSHYQIDWVLDETPPNGQSPVRLAPSQPSLFDYSLPVPPTPSKVALPPEIPTARDTRYSSASVRLNTLQPSLNPKYTFQTFVVGSCNQLAHAAALAVADAPGKTYNPFYIYGGVGLGKTHLMQAVGRAISDATPALRICYISLENFMNELINAIKCGPDKTQAFRERYRSIDVLLMDDIQFITGKGRTQEEFFHTFDALYNAQKQIVITSDCPPREIPMEIEDRLHSRFEWGLIADIEPPDLETKVAILKRKADLDGFELPDDVALFIATKVKHNIRELEGSLVRLLAISSLRGLPISKMLAQDAIRTIVETQEEDGISIAKIQRTVAAYYGMSVEKLTARSNARHVSAPRQVAMYLCKRLTKSSFPEIGRQFGGKHHTTVIHSVEKVEHLLPTDPALHKAVSTLIDRLCS